MKAFSRTTVAAAVALAGALVSTNAPAVSLSADGVGQVAIAPLYTVRNGWQTAINLTNVTDAPLLVKVRFHEGHNSRDVLDFNVALSAFDVFTGVVRTNANGAPVFVNTDAPNTDGLYTCTIPNTRTAGGTGDAIEVPLNHLGFSGTSVGNEGTTSGVSNDDGGLGGDSGNQPNAGALERLKEGYIEFIVMGHTDPTLSDVDDPVVFTALNEPVAAGGALVGATNISRAIEQHDCASLQPALGFNNNYTVQKAQWASRQFGQPINALKFTFALINPQAGLAAGSPATTWSGFYEPVNGSGAGDFVEPAGFVLPSDNFQCVIARGMEHTNVPLAQRLNWCPDGSAGDDCATVAAPAGAAVLANGESCRNLVTLQGTTEFLEPTLNDAFPHQALIPNTNTGAGFGNSQFADNIDVATPLYENSFLDAAGNVVEETRGIDALSLTIQRQRMYNQWSNNPTLGSRVEWVVTQPTKAFYVDQGDGIQFQVPVPTNGGEIAGALPRNEAFVDEYNGANAFANAGAVPYLPYQNRFAQEVLNDRTTARACNTVGFSLFDRAEQPLGAAPAGDPPFSPAPPPVSDPDDLCYETTIITFGPSTLGTAQNRLDISADIAALTVQTGNDAGWASMVMGPDVDAAGLLVSNTAYDGAYLLGNSNAFGGPIGYSGLPVIGFTLATLNFPSRPDLSFGSAVEHSYTRAGIDGADAVVTVAP